MENSFSAQSKIEINPLISGLTIFALTEFNPDMVFYLQDKYLRLQNELTTQGGRDRGKYEQIVHIALWNGDHKINFPLDHEFLHMIRNESKGINFWFDEIFYDTHLIFHLLYTFQPRRQYIAGEINKCHTVDIESAMNPDGRYNPIEEEFIELFYLIPPKATPASLMNTGNKVMNEISPKKFNTNRERVYRWRMTKYTSK